MNTKFTRWIWGLAVLVAVPNGVLAQSMPVGTPFWEEALRRGQLLGHLDSNVSMMIRPVDPSAAFGMSLGWGYDSLWCPGPMLRSVRPQWDWRSDNYGNNRYQIHGWRGFVESCKEFRVQVLPVLIQARYNEHHPYGWSDGPMVPSKGMQTYASAGAFVKAGPLEVQYRPEWVVARNEDFLNPLLRERSIDNPERMGTKPYRELHAGQSCVRLRLGPISTGWSSENIWWGPGVRNSILMSNNAPGISHFTLHTNRPLRTPLGTFEGQMIAGNLRYSGYWPYEINSVSNPNDSTAFPATPDLKWDTLRGTGTHSFINAMQLVWQPRGLSGLFLGINRGVQVKGYPANLGEYLRIIYVDPLGSATTNSERNELNRNQIVTINMRYLFRRSHAEIYAEWARDDHWYDWEDFLTRPLATSAWLGGFRKIYSMPGDGWLQVWGEATVIQAPMDNFMQPSVSVVSFYQHSNRVGWTHRGQVLGAGIGPGSNMTTLGVEYGRRTTGVGLHWERVVYNEDLFYTRGPSLGFPNPWFRDISKHFVDWGWQLNFFHNFGRTMMTGRYNLLRTYNFQYRYDPDGVQGAFRFPGINVWSHNLDMALIYRF